MISDGVYKLNLEPDMILNGFLEYLDSDMMSNGAYKHILESDTLLNGAYKHHLESDMISNGAYIPGQRPM